MDLNLEELIRLFRGRWERVSTLILLLLIISFGLIWKFTDTNLSDLSISEIIFIIAVQLVVFLWWYFDNSIKKAPRGKFGLAIAISCEGEREQERIAADFITVIRRLLQTGNPGKLFYLIEIPERHAKKITDQEIAGGIRKRARCDFIVWGNAKLREINGHKKHILNLEAQVAHRSVAIEVSNKFSHEMSELFPRRLHIDINNDLFSFEFTSEWIDCVARYIIGIAATISGDISFSESLFRDLLNNKHLQTSPIPQIKKIKQRVPIRLGDIYAYYASLAYQKWLKDKNEEHLIEMWNNLTHIRRIYPQNYQGHLLTAIYYFIKDRNITAAIHEIKKCRNVRDATWRYNYAFLLAYKGDMKKARRIYKAAYNLDSQRADVPLQTEEFILKVLEQEPGKIQLIFCLGLINWHAKGDLKKAIDDFQTFLKTNSNNIKFKEEYRLAEEYILNIEGELEKLDNKE